MRVFDSIVAVAEIANINPVPVDPVPALELELANLDC